MMEDEGNAEPDQPSDFQTLIQSALQVVQTPEGHYRGAGMMTWPDSHPLIYCHKAIFYLFCVELLKNALFEEFENC